MEQTQKHKYKVKATLTFTKLQDIEATSIEEAKTLATDRTGNELWSYGIFENCHQGGYSFEKEDYVVAGLD